jgi:hypothetical protein
MEIRQLRLCLWCGPLFVLSFAVGFWGCAGFLPPPSPLLTAAEVAAFYQSNTNMIRLGVAIVMIGLISTLMKRIKGCSTALIYTQLGAGSAGIILFILPCIFWFLTAFRPERDPQITLLLNDLSWLSLVTPVSLAMVQFLALAIAILSDRSEHPIFPRWAGYYNLWLSLIFFPGIVAAFFKSGPFAWNGIFPFWIPATLFFSWFIVMFVVLGRAIESQGTDSTLQNAAGATGAGLRS